MSELESILAFLREAEGLKSVTRTAWTAAGRRESTAEHSWRLALMALVVLADYPALDRSRVLALCLVHDLGERYEGDRCASDQPDPEEKRRAEQAAIRRMCALLPKAQGTEILDLWTEYEAGMTPEARLVKALDKAETILQHNQGANPPDFDYDFNLEYGKPLFGGDPFLSELRGILDRETQGRMDRQKEKGCGP